MFNKKKNHVGEIYSIDPRHVIKKNELKDYNKNKGLAKNNNRLVMVSEQRAGKRVQVSKMTTKVSDQQLARKQRVKLEKTYKNKDSYVNTDTQGKSRLTGKNFVIGKDPLLKKQKNAHKDDLVEFEKARKSRRK